MGTLTSTPDIESIYDIDNAKGEIYHKITSQRMIVLDADSWLTMTRNLTKIFSSGAETILFEAGRAFGTNVIATATKLMPSRTERARFLSNFASVSGWGSFEYELRKNGAVIETKNYALADTTRNLGKPSCFFLKGVYQGLYEVILGKNAVVEETRCRSQGDAVCRFEIKI